MTSGIHIKRRSVLKHAQALLADADEFLCIIKTKTNPDTFTVCGNHRKAMLPTTILMLSEKLPQWMRDELGKQLQRPIPEDEPDVYY